MSGYLLVTVTPGLIGSHYRLYSALVGSFNLSARRRRPPPLNLRYVHIIGTTPRPPLHPPHKPLITQVNLLAQPAPDTPLSSPLANEPTVSPTSYRALLCKMPQQRVHEKPPRRARLTHRRIETAPYPLTIPARTGLSTTSRVNSSR